jgi:hypothetical protein
MIVYLYFNDIFYEKASSDSHRITDMTVGIYLLVLVYL